MLCATKLKRNQKRNCAKKRTVGLRERVWVGMLEDLAGSVVNSTTKTILDSFTLASGAKLAVYDGILLSNQATLGSNRTDFSNDVSQTFRLMIFDDSPEAEEEIQTLLNRDDIFLINQKKGRGGYFKVYGFNTGMSSALATDSNDTGTNGAHVITLTANAEDMPFTLIHKAAGVEDTLAYLTAMELADPA